MTKNAHNKQRATTVGRPKRTVNFCTTFSSINKAFAIVQKYPAATVCVCYYPPGARKCRFCRPINGRRVSLKLAGTLSGSQYPNGGVLRESTAQSGSRPLFGSGNATRTAPLWTEPTRTLRWKRTISYVPPDDGNNSEHTSYPRSCWVSHRHDSKDSLM